VEIPPDTRGVGVELLGYLAGGRQGGGVERPQSFSYTRDADGDVTEEQATGAIDKTTTYAYGKLDRVIGQGSSSPAPTSSYTYDAARQITGLSSGATQTYDAAGELETQTASGGGTTDFTYDALGERTEEAPPTGSPTTYGYDEAGHLTSIAEPTISSTYAYNGDGLRMSETTSSVTEQFTWDTASSTPALLVDSTNAYIYGLGNAPIEQVNLSSHAVSYLVTNAVGSVRAVVNSSGTVTATTSYDAYGTPTATGGLTASTPFGFAGRYTDATGLVYLIARYYDPATDQFLSADPLEGMTRQAYAYAADDPVNQDDPDGMAPNPSTGHPTPDELKGHLKQINDEEVPVDEDFRSVLPSGMTPDDQYVAALERLAKFYSIGWPYKQTTINLAKVTLNGEQQVVAFVNGASVPDGIMQILNSLHIPTWQLQGLDPGLSHSEMAAEGFRYMYKT
jgi:RHS repeat-associated protein